MNVGQPVETGPRSGETFEGLELRMLDGATVSVPDPGGHYVILELIRSADW